jgi:hypothetical protein
VKKRCLFGLGGLAVLLTLTASCTSTELQYAPLPVREERAASASERELEGEETEVPAAVPALENILETRGAFLALPAEWRLYRFGPWMHSPELEGAHPAGGAGAAFRREMLAGAPVLFSSPDERYWGLFRTVIGIEAVEPRAYLVHFIESMVPPGKRLALLQPDPEAQRDWYLLRWSADEGTMEAAFWFGRYREQGLDTSAAYICVLKLPVAPEAPAAPEAEEAAGARKSEAETGVPLPSQQDRILRNAIFAEIRRRPEDLESRRIPGRLRFLSSSGWRWLADYGEGLILAGQAAGRPATLVLTRLEREINPARVLAFHNRGAAEGAGPGGGTAEGAGLEPAGLEAEESFPLYLLIDNERHEVAGAGSYTRNGGLVVSYTIPATLAGGPWAATLSLAGSTAEGEPSEQPPLPQLSEVHRLPAIAALFQRQLFFHLENSLRGGENPAGELSGEENGDE